MQKIVPFWFKDGKGEALGMSKSKSDLDAVAMAPSVGESRVTYLYIKETRVDVTGSDIALRGKVSIDGGGVGQSGVSLEENVKGTAGEDVEHEEAEEEEEGELHDFECSLHSDGEEV